MDLASRIKQLREGAGLTQLDLAKILQVSNSTLSQYESGAPCPQAMKMKASIADYFWGLSGLSLWKKLTRDKVDKTIQKKSPGRFLGWREGSDPGGLDAMWMMWSDLRLCRPEAPGGERET